MMWFQHCNNTTTLNYNTVLPAERQYRGEDYKYMEERERAIQG